MPANVTMSPAILSTLVAQVASGSLKPANLLSVIPPNTPIQVGDWRVSFKKNRPGNFTVQTFEGEGQDPVTQITAGSLVEAKLEAIGLAVERYNQDHQGDNQQRR